MRPCSAGVTTNVHASCPFAESILAAYASPAAEKEEERSETAAVHLTVESPTTRRTYAVACSQQVAVKIINCRAGNDATVTLTLRALIETRAHGERLTPVQISNGEGVLLQRPACGPTCHMTPSEKRAYEAEQERKAEALRQRFAPKGPGYYPHCRYGKQEPESTHPDREERGNGVTSEEVRPARCLYPNGNPETAFQEEREQWSQEHGGATPPPIPPEQAAEEAAQRVYNSEAYPGR